MLVMTASEAEHKHALQTAALRGVWCVQPNKGARLFEEVLQRLVYHRKLSLACACGLVRRLHMYRLVSLALSDLRAASWLCKALKFLVHRRDTDLRTNAVCDIYASCRINLLDLIPQVSSVIVIYRFRMFGSCM